MRVSKLFFCKAPKEGIIQKLAGPRFKEDMEIFFPRDYSRIFDSSLTKVELQCSPGSVKKLSRVLIEPLWSYMDRPSKLMRPALVQLAADFLDCKGEQIKSLKLYIEAVHNASLILDDIQDSSLLRRGLPTAHVLFGMDVAAGSKTRLLAIDVLMALLRSLKGLDDGLEVGLRRFHDQIFNAILFGTTLDVAWHKDKTLKDIPPFEDYCTMIILKTAMILMKTTEMMSLFGSDLGQIGHLQKALMYFGMGFQVRDDVINIDSSEYSKKKGFAEDIYEGKMSFMIVIALRNLKSEAQKQKLLSLMNKKDKDAKDVEEAISIIKSSKAIDEGKAMFTKYFDQSVEVLERNFPQKAEQIEDFKEVIRFVLKN